MGYLQSLKLERQNYAFDIVKTKHNNNKEYKSKIESLGMMIYNNGLVSTLAQLKKKEPVVYDHLKDWIKKRKVVGFEALNNQDLLEKILALEDSMVLHALTLEILALTNALKEILKAEVA